MKQLAFLIILLLGTLVSFLTSEIPDQLRHNLGTEDKGSDNCTYIITKPSAGISKNGTLQPSDHCEWHVVGNESHIGSSSLLFEKVHLEADDSLIIKDTQENVIFGPYNGTQGPLVIAVDEKNFTVVLNVSNNKGSRTFQLLYSDSCIFSIPPFIDVIESPIYRVRRKHISCTYNYKAAMENISHSFVFKSFNLDSESELVVTETELQDDVYKKTPPDIFGHVARFNMTLNINSTGNNLTVMRRNVFRSCSGYIELPSTLVAMLHSPPAVTLPDDSINYECRWLLKYTDGNSVLKLQIGKLQFSSVFDMLTINNGPSELSPPLVQATLITQEETKAQAIITSGQYLWISFKSEAFASNFSGNSTQATGGYYTGSGRISAQSNAEFLLEAGKTEKVLLNFSSSSLTSPAALNIYDSFDTMSAPIAQLSGNVWYPVVSGTSKMMVVTKNLDASKTFTAHFSGIKSDCIHMSALADDTYVVAGNCNMTCVWVVPPKTASGEQVLVLEFHLLSLDSSDVIEVFRLSDNKTPVASVLHGTKYVPPLTFDPAEGFYMNVSRGMCKSEEVVLVAHATYLPGCSRNFSLVPSNELQLSSPNYPNMYPLLASCEWNFKASGSTTQFYLAFESIDLAPGHSIQIIHTVAGVTKTEVIRGNQLPSDLLLQNVSVSFNSSNSSVGVSLVSGEGFVLNVTSSDCGSVMRNKTGQFNTSLAVSKDPSSCFWIIEIPYNEADGSVNSIMFTVEEKDVKNNNSEFHIYDGPSVHQPLITNYTGNIWSHNNTVIFVYKRFDSSVSSNVYKVNYQTINCNKTSQCENGICLHPDWRCNGANDCGDFTDERDCGTIPVPKPQNETDNKISAVTFGVVTVLFFILGALAAFLIPKAINRYRSGRYHQFQDYSNVD